jgi:hypothetical protein
MRNGYALCSHRGLEAISKRLGALERREIEELQKIETRSRRHL